MSRFWPAFRRKTEISSEISIKVDFNLDDRTGSICALVERLQPIFNEQVSAWHIDLSACDYLGPHAGALLVASLLESRSRKQSARITLPIKSKQLMAFCEFSGLSHYVTGSSFPDRNDSRNVTIPMRSITRASLNDPDPVVDLIQSKVHVSPDTEEYLRICINEVLQNVEDHAKSSIGAIISARYKSYNRKSWMTGI